jgi:hypothetical protein
MKITNRRELTTYLTRMRVLSYIATHLDKAGLYTHADGFTAKKISMSRPTVGRVINELDEHGFLTVLTKPEKGSDGKQTIRVVQVSPKGYNALALSVELGQMTNTQKNRAHEQPEKPCLRDSKKPCSMDIVHSNSKCRVEGCSLPSVCDYTAEPEKNSHSDSMTGPLWTPEVIRLYEDFHTHDILIASNIAASFWAPLRNGQVVYPAQLRTTELLPECPCGSRRIVDYHTQDLQNRKVKLFYKPECYVCITRRQFAERAARVAENTREVNIAAKALFDADTARELSLREKARPLEEGYLTSDQYRTSCGMTYLTDKVFVPPCECGKPVYYELTKTEMGGVLVSMSSSCETCMQAQMQNPLTSRNGVYVQ